MFFIFICFRVVFLIQIFDSEFVTYDDWMNVGLRHVSIIFVLVNIIWYSVSFDVTLYKYVCLVIHMLYSYFLPWSSVWAWSCFLVVSYFFGNLSLMFLIYVYFLIKKYLSFEWHVTIFWTCPCIKNVVSFTT